MGLYVSHGNVYAQLDDGTVYPVNVTAKNKLVRTEQVDSTKVEYLKEPVQLPADAVGATMDDLVRKFNLSEDRPVKFDESKHRAALGENVEKPSEDSDDDLFGNAPKNPVEEPQKPPAKRRGRPKKSA